MLKFLVSFFFGAVALPLADYLFEGFWCVNIETALIAGCFLMLIYTFIRPIFRLLLKPLSFLTMGLLNLVIDVFLLNFIARLTPDMIKFYSVEWIIYTALFINGTRFIAHLFVPSENGKR